MLFGQARNQAWTTDNGYKLLQQRTSNLRLSASPQGSRVWLVKEMADSVLVRLQHGGSLAEDLTSAPCRFKCLALADFSAGAVFMKLT